MTPFFVWCLCMAITHTCFETKVSLHWFGYIVQRLVVSEKVLAGTELSRKRCWPGPSCLGRGTGRDRVVSEEVLAVTEGTEITGGEESRRLCLSPHRLHQNDSCKAGSDESFFVFDVDRFYIVLFSALEQAHCAYVWFYMSGQLFIALF